MIACYLPNCVRRHSSQRFFLVDYDEVLAVAVAVVVAAADAAVGEEDAGNRDCRCLRQARECYSLSKQSWVVVESVQANDVPAEADERHSLARVIQEIEMALAAALAVVALDAAWILAVCVAGSQAAAAAAAGGGALPDCQLPCCCAEARVAVAVRSGWSQAG